LAVVRGQSSLSPPAQANTIADRELATWKLIKAALLAPDGENYFDMSIQGALLPTFKGRVVRLEPETNPSTIVLAVEGGATPDATLKFGRPLKGRLARGCS
jgi:hypothetical protein